MDTAHSTQLKVVSGMKSLKLQLSQQSSNVGKVLVAQQNLVSDEQHTREEIQHIRKEMKPMRKEKFQNIGKPTQSLFQMCRNVHGYECPLIEPDLNKIPSKIRKMFERLHPEYININTTQFIQVWRQFQQLDIPRRIVQKNPRGMFPNIDSITLFGMVQTLNPRTILEIGAGESTAIIDATKVKVKRVIVEPYRQNKVPKQHIVIEKEIQDVDNTVYDSLEEGDFLFIDSSHVTMPYGDTLLELLFILPRLQKGVFVHIHDVFLPYDYPFAKNWPGLGTKSRVYTEQWLVALMLRSNEYEVIWGSHAMVREQKATLLKMKHINGVDYHSGSIWLKKLSNPIR